MKEWLKQMWDVCRFAALCAPYWALLPRSANWAEFWLVPIAFWFVLGTWADQTRAQIIASLRADDPVYPKLIELQEAVKSASISSRAQIDFLLERIAASDR